MTRPSIVLSKYLQRYKEIAASPLDLCHDFALPTTLKVTGMTQRLKLAIKWLAVKGAAAMPPEVSPVVGAGQASRSAPIR